MRAVTVYRMDSTMKIKNISFFLGIVLEQRSYGTGE